MTVPLVGGGAGRVGSRVVTVNDVLARHAVLDIESLDRIYLTGWVNNLQVAGQVVRFLHEHRRMPIASRALFERIGTGFRRAIEHFA